MSALEWSLLRGATSFDQPQPSRSYSLAVSLVEADFKAVLLSAEAKHVFERSPKLFEGLAELQEGPTATHLALGQDDQFILYTVAIALLQSFVQSNWTGPDLTFAPLDLIPSSGSNISNEKLNASSLPFLTLQGEPAYHLCSQPALLLLSIRLLKLLSAQTAPPATLPWWLLRSHLVHQALLDEPIELQPDVLAVVRDLPQSMPDDPDLLASLRLELGLYHHSLGHDKLANQEFLTAAQASGLEFELTGAMGKRTKFQIELHSQLVLLAESRHRIGEDDKPPDHAAGTNGNGHVPEALPLNDDTLLEETEFTKRTSSDGSGSSRLSHLDPASQPPLNPLDQSLLLSLCLSQHNHSPASGLTASQMMPFISRVLSHPRNWSIHTTALLLRSRLQSTRSRTVERSTLQLAALIEQMPTSDSCPQERLEYFHQLPLPSKWEMERELAKRYLSLGVVRSALDIFTRLEMWEDAVGCLQRMERESEAEAIVRDLLAGRKVESDLVHELGRASLSERRKIKLEAGREAKLWCLLGDITLTSENARKDPDAAKSTAAEHYEKAWEVSGKTSSRAMRTLGSLHFSAKEYDLAIPCSKAGLDINPLFARAWFTLGVCYVRLERWSEARDAFRKEVGVDDEDAEGWNNLAAVYLRLGETGCSSSGSPSTVAFENKIQAFRALRSGLRHAHTNWRMWQNYMIVAIDVGELSESARAMTRVLEIQGNAIDVDVLDKLVDSVTRDDYRSGQGVGEKVVPTSSNEGFGLLPTVERLFDATILPKISDNARVWRAHGRLLRWKEDRAGAMEDYLLAYRCGPVSDPSVEREKAKFVEAVEEIVELVDVLSILGPTLGEVGGMGKKKGDWRFQARGIVRTFIGRTRNAFGDEPEMEKLREMLEDLKRVD